MQGLCSAPWRRLSVFLKGSAWVLKQAVHDSSRKGCYVTSRARLAGRCWLQGSGGQYRQMWPAPSHQGKMIFSLFAAHELLFVTLYLRKTRARPPWLEATGTFQYVTHRSRLWICVILAGKGQWKDQPLTVGISLPKLDKWILSAPSYLHVIEQFSRCFAGRGEKEFWTQFLTSWDLFGFFAVISALLEIRNPGALST